MTAAPRPGTDDDLGSLADGAVALARRWMDEARAETATERTASARLAALVGDPSGLDLAVRFVDRVARPEDLAVAGHELAQLPPGAARFLAPTDRVLLSAGRLLAPHLPRLVVPLARRRLRQLVGHLVVDAHDPALAQHIERSRRDGFRLNLNLLGEAVLGEAEAARRAERTLALLERPDVDYVSVKVSSLVSQISTWDTAGTVERVLHRLRPLYLAAAAATPPKFVNLDMEEYRDLDLTVAAFTRLLSEPELHGLEAGIVLQAYLPDSLAALEQLMDFALRRRDAGGAGIKVRFVKGANLSMERVDAELHGWAQAPYDNKADVDASYLRLLDRALVPELSGALRVGAASHNVYDLALAHLLAERRGVAGALDVEMLQGMAPAQARAVRDTVGTVILYTPVVAPADFDVAVSYLVRRLEENAQPESFLHALFTGDAADGVLPDQEARFRASVTERHVVPAERRRAPGRPRLRKRSEFSNTTDSDPALDEVREWAAACVTSAPPPVSSRELTSLDDVDDVVGRALRSHAGWSATPPAERATILRRAADELEARRSELVAVMAAEAGKTAAEADPEVSEAVDFARYYADRAEELDPAAGHASTDGARFAPTRVTLVTPPWNFPVAIPTGSVLAALAAGSAVVIKPAHAVPACAEVAMGALQAALADGGAAADVLQVVRADERDVGRSLVSHPDVETVLLTGSIETARLFRSWRAAHPAGPRVMAETSGKNAVVITPSADFDLAVGDVVRSAFGHAGQKCSAASLVILVGSAGRSPRLLRQLVDAVRSVRTGWPSSLGTTMGPLIEPPTDKLLRALTSLAPGERWLAEPQRLDDSGRLWSPGLKDGVAPGSWFHRTECFGPVLGIMRAETLDDAIDLQNGTDFGLTGGLHSLDDDEIDRWLERVEVGNAYVNRHITGAIVQRQPFGGWKASAVGPGAKAGGPDYVAQLGTWEPVGLPERVDTPEDHLRGAFPSLAKLAATAEEREWLVVAVGSDAAAWSEELGREIDRTGLAVEANVLRHRPLDHVTIRAGAGAAPVELARMIAAARLARTPVRLSVDPDLWERVRAQAPPSAWLPPSAPVVIETWDELVERCRAGAVTGRLRVLGVERRTLPGALAGTDVTVLAAPVLATGRRELLSVLREQAISRTVHRFGHLPADGLRPSRRWNARGSCT